MGYPPQILHLLNACPIEQATPLVEQSIREATDERFSTDTSYCIGDGWSLE